MLGLPTKATVKGGVSGPVRSLGGYRLDHDAQQLVGPQANLVSRQPQNAGIARPKHLDWVPPPKPELFEPVNVVGRAQDLGDSPGAARREQSQRNDSMGGAVRHDSRFAAARGGEQQNCGERFLFVTLNPVYSILPPAARQVRLFAWLVAFRSAKEAHFRGAKGDID